MSPTRYAWRGSRAVLRFRRIVLAAAMLPGLALSAGPALAADRESISEAEIQSALQRDLKLTAEEVKEQGTLQARAIKRDQQLQASLGSAYAGSIYDAKGGKLVAMVSDARQIAKARAIGAEAKLVKHSKAKLERIKAALDAAAGTSAGSAPTERRANLQPQTPVAGVISWYVDTASNTVRVTVKKGQTKTAEAALAKYGDAVTIEPTDLVPTTTADYMDGGDVLKTNLGHCSAGFNLRNQSTRVGHLLTAGHCVKRGERVSGQGGIFGWGVDFGPVLESWFPTFDDALVRNDYPQWIQGPWVDFNPSNGPIIQVSGFTDAPVGTFVCKSGITTMWTCGAITGKDETVVFDGVNTVKGLTRHSACVEKGDSGGSNVSVTNVYAAEGVTSGATLMSDGSRPRCLSAFGRQNVSWYFPIADSLAYYGPGYSVSLW